MPIWAAWLKPVWCAIVFFYWTVTFPGSTGLGIAWGLGLTLDVLQGTLLGEQALVMVFVAYLAINLERRMRFASFSQQAVLLFFLLLTYQLFLLLVQGMVGQFRHGLQFLLPAVSGVLFWPLVATLLQMLSGRPQFSRR